ncbi:MAG: IS256 family transposase [Thermodesulfovibrionales bacterium]
MSIVTKSYERVKPAEINFDEGTIDRRLTELVKGTKVTEESFWDSLSSYVLQTVKKVVEGCLEEETKLMIGACWYERSPIRTGERSGHYKRELITRYGLIKDLMVPKIRKRKNRGGFKVLKKYLRRVEDIDGLIRDMFLAGVSTRRVGEVIRPLLGYKYSPGFVSDILKQIDTKVREFHNRVLSDDYIYLLFDGLTLKVRYNGKVHKKKVLVAYGIKKAGQREIIDYTLAKGESTIAWESFVNGLYMKGLEGKNLKLITTDGNQGLLNALDLVYSRIPKQRCWAHKLRNVTNKCPRKLQKSVIEEARKIYQQETKSQAYRQFKHFRAIWHAVIPTAVDCIEENLEELLYFYDCPVEMWKKIRTTNVIERSFREVRRRIRTISAFTNVDSCDRIIYGVFNYMNSKWEEKPLLEILKAESAKTP